MAEVVKSKSSDCAATVSTTDLQIFLTAKFLTQPQQQLHWTHPYTNFFFILKHDVALASTIS
jgi:hypothetical protein